MAYSPIHTWKADEVAMASTLNKYIEQNTGAFIEFGKVLGERYCATKQCEFCGGDSFRHNKYRDWDECAGCGAQKS